MDGSFLAFLGVSAIVIVTPGQDTALTIRNTLAGGRRAGLATALGVVTGQSCWTLAASVGLTALLVASERGVKDHKLKPVARIVSAAVAGVEPRIMGMGPVPSSRLALKRAGLKLEDMDVIELNEAFAAQVLACLRELGVEDEDPRVNPNGGAIALGHPLGMSGARLVLTASHELQRTNKRYALCTMCIGVGQGMAVVVERV